MATEIKSNLIKDETINLLTKFQILKELSKNEILKLLGKEGLEYQKRIAKLVQYEKREIVIKEGDFDSWIFWVVQGEFSVIKKKMAIVVFDRPGEVFGEMSILDADRRTASVIATKQSVCLCIDMSILDTLGDDNIINKIRKGIQHLKSLRLNLTTEKLVVEKEKVIIQQKEIKTERKKLKEKEEELDKREKVLIEKEKNLIALEKEYDKTEKDD